MIYAFKVTALTNGKCLLTGIDSNKFKNLFSQEKHRFSLPLF